MNSTSKKRSNKVKNMSRCKYCETLDDDHEEMITLTNTNLLSLYENVSENNSHNNLDDDDRPQHRVINFVIHDNKNVMCSFDCGKIEKGKEVYLCGVVLPVYHGHEDQLEDNDQDNQLTLTEKQGIPTKLIGPLVEWWFAGFDGGSQVIIGVESPYASYILSQPSSQFKQLFLNSSHRILLTKLVIESLSKNIDLDYDDLLVEVKERNNNFTDEDLLQNASFIVEQIRSYDSVGDEDEYDLAETQAIKDLIFLAGVESDNDVEMKRVCHMRPIARHDNRRSINSDTLTVSTQLVRSFFDKIFKEVIQPEVKSKKSKTASIKKPKEKTNLEKMRANWIGDVIHEDKFARRNYYKSVSVNEEIFSIGDFVLVNYEESLRHGRIMFMFETSNRKMCHIQWFCLGKDTVLGQASLDSLIFMIMDCCDTQIHLINSKCDIKMLNNIDDFEEHVTYCNKLYQPSSGTFEDLPQQVFDNDIKCLSCVAKERQESMRIPVLSSHYETQQRENVTVYKHESIEMNGKKFCIGDCILVSPKAFEMHFHEYGETSLTGEKEIQDEDYDEELYPEKYRKSLSEFVKGSYYDLPLLCHICCIKDIYKHCNDSDDEAKIVVYKFYRPHNVFEAYADYLCCDLNLIFWSSEQVTINPVHLINKCNIIYSSENSINDIYLTPNSFYFNEAFNSENNMFENVATDICDQFKLKQLNEETCSQTDSSLTKSVKTELRTLDLFSGCGGMSYGFHTTGLSSQVWAIEKDPVIARSYEENFPNATVFHDDVNHILNLVLQGIGFNKKKQRLPRKGEVDLILGGPPCQGFSGMNRFSARQYSLFKNSLIVSFLSFVDFYRPKYLIFENVRNFALFKNSMILQLTLSCLVRMGYQCEFAILQAGCYGLPQTRRRTVIIGASTGHSLPPFPQPTHSFSTRQCHLSIIVKNRKYASKFDLSAAAYRHVTIEDAISDLPRLNKGDYYKPKERAYATTSITHYQKLMRTHPDVALRDHHCKELGGLCLARIENIPKIGGVDWRDLPNLRYELDNGIIINKLEYNYDDKKNGRSRSGCHRGVCACATGDKCNASECRQENTLIPWCLVHTANRQYQWSGLYGRLSWQGYFPTTVTNPEPISKQGRVLHPDQTRIISIRESARSQGFPDNFILTGTTVERYRQIGNAVPPPMAIAIARELKNVIS